MSKSKTLRVTEFRGLNKATNPHNIHDRELVELTNMFVTKNRGLESRKGYRRIGDVATNFVKSLFTTAWSKTDDRLYYVNNGTLGKMDADGSTTTITPGINWGRTAQFNRYRDKVLFLNENSYLQWFNEDEELSLVKYPKPMARRDLGTLVNSTGGGLKVDSYYEYCISLILGDDYLDGEGQGSDSNQPEYQRIGDHYVAATGVTGVDDTDLTIVGTSISYDVMNLYGYNIGRVNLYRRRVSIFDTAVASAAKPIGPWRLVDIANISLDKATGAYSLSMSETGVITGFDGNYYSADDLATLWFDFTDTGLMSDEETPNGDLQSPWFEGDVVQVRASHMARLHNRIFLANIVGSGQSTDTKKVYYSYRGWIEAINESEIAGIGWEHPMLIFPVMNYFMCDAEDTEDPITAITTYRDSVIVFTERCMFLWREGMGDPVKVSNDLGCVSKRSLIEFEGKLIWLAHSGIFMYDGSKLTNMTVDKMQPYIDDIPKEYIDRAKACIFDRKYFIAGPFEGGTLADVMLVYDFDVEAWHVRKYKIGSSETCYIDMLYTDRDGAAETLYAAIKDPSANCIIATLETGYTDQQNPGQGDSEIGIDCTIKTKYYSFDAPDVEKTYRNLLLDADNYYEDIDLSVYIDSLDDPKEEFTHRNLTDGFLLGSATNGMLGTNSLQTTSDEIFAFSLPRGLIGSRIQYSADLTANTTPLYIHLIGFDWTPKRKLKRRYGA